MAHTPSKHDASCDGASGSVALEGDCVHRCQRIDSRTVCRFFLVATIALLLACAVVLDLEADNTYPNCTIMAIDTSSGLVTSHETSTGKVFYFQVTDPAQLELLRTHQGISINNGQVSFDGAKPCACKIVSSPADVTSEPKSRVPLNAGQRLAGAAEGSDLLVLRDGKRQSGSLVTCAVDTCLMGTSVVPRENIQWIGLSLSQKLQATPPPLQNSATDELHLADGSVHSGSVLGIRAHSVETAGKSYDRKEVKWVYLAPVSGKPRGGPAPSAPPPGSTPPNPPAFPSILGSKGGLWIGTVQGERTVTYTGPPLVVHHYTNTIRVKLREVVGGYVMNSDPAHFHRVGSVIDLKNEGTQVEVGYQGASCSDHAASSYPDDGIVGHFWYKTVNEPIKRGNDIPPEGLYTLTLGTGGPVVLPLCQKYFRSFDQLGGRPIEIGYLWGPGSAPPDRAKLASDAWDPEGYRKVSADHARMVGDYTYENPCLDRSYCSEHVKVNWNICRVGSSGCSMGPPCCDQAQLVQAQVKSLEDRLKQLEQKLSGPEVTLGSEGSSIHIGKEGISIKSSGNITINSDKDVTIKGANLHQN